MKSPFPCDLADLSKRLASFIVATEDYKPEAAIINYYPQGANMGGHQDDAEPAMDRPIVSISIGCPAIFLIGGRDKSITPIPILVRSGDVIILSDESRYAYHGVPLVLPMCEAGVEAAQCELATFLYENNNKDYKGVNECDNHVKTYLRTCRLNMNIRQVVHDENDLIVRH